MKLSDLYTTGTVAKRNNDGSSVAYVCTRPLSELYPDLDMEFDTTILLNNGSTSELMSKGAYGTTFTAYNKSNTLYNGEPTTQITYLGCCIVLGWNNGNIINLSKHLISSGTSWENMSKYLRFVINVVSSDGIGYTDYIPFDLNNTTNIIYDFNSTYVLGEFGYRKTNTTRDVTGYVNDVHSLDGLGDDGNNGNRICSDSYSVWGTSYNKYLSDNKTISKTNIGILCFVYYINGQYFMLRGNFNAPDSGYNHQKFTIDNIKYYVTIGAFKEFDDGISGFLPENDETKGAFAFKHNASGQYVNCSNYFATSNCADYTINSCGLRWVTTSSISTAKDFRDDVRLGVMDNNGIVSHKEWIIGETAIQSSDNPNKNTSYDNIPDRNNNSGDLNDDIDDTLLGHDLYVNGFVNYFQVTAGNLTDISTAISNETEKTGLLNNVISLKSYVVPTSAFLSAGSTVLSPIKLNGVTVLESAPKIVAHSMKFHLGDYTINGRYGNATSPHFLDKTPYTIIELYIPFCGIVTLPDKCMYNTISVDLLSDLFSGGCIAVVKCNGAIVAEKTGIIGYDIPLSALNTAELSHALLNNVLKSVDIGANTIISGATGNVGGILSGAMAGTNNMLSMYHTANQNYTTIVGNSGSKSEYALPPQCYVKISTKIAKYPDNYTHTIGKPCCKTKKLSDCNGFTVCNNVDINVSATDTEKRMIKQLLETGIYI